MKTIFEKIINNEIPSFKLYEDNDFIVILDSFPKSTGHTLVIPKKVKVNILEEDENTLNGLMKLVQKMAKQIKANLNADGVKIISNIDKAGGQEVFHTHIHIIPFYNKTTKVIIDEEVAKKIRG